jgi:hypothetical protein
MNLLKLFPWKVMERKDPIRGNQLEALIVKNGRRTGARLLRRLEEQDNPTTTRWISVQILGKPSHHRRMPVVPAAVRDTGPARTIFDAVVLLYGDCIDLGPKHD